KYKPPPKADASPDADANPDANADQPDAESVRATSEGERRGRAWLKRLEDGEPWATALWMRFREVSWAEFEEVYKLLGIRYDDLNGESHFWRQAEQTIIPELRAKNLLSESKGAQVVELEGEKTPFIVLTQDGTTLYATRDLAA